MTTGSSNAGTRAAQPLHAHNTHVALLVLSIGFLVGGVLAPPESTPSLVHRASALPPRPRTRSKRPRHSATPAHDRQPRLPEATGPFRQSSKIDPGTAKNSPAGGPGLET